MTPDQYSITDRARKRFEGLLSPFQKQCLESYGLTIYKGGSGIYWGMSMASNTMYIGWMTDHYYGLYRKEPDALEAACKSFSFAKLVSPRDVLCNIANMCIGPAIDINRYDYAYTILRLLMSKGGERYLCSTGNFLYTPTTSAEQVMIYQFLYWYRANSNANKDSIRTRNGILRELRTMIGNERAEQLDKAIPLYE